MTAQPLWYPLFLDMRDRNALIVGGGSVAVRKARHLIDCGASVVLVAPEIDPRIVEMEDGNFLHVERRTFAREDVNGRFFVIAATSSAAVNAEVAEACSEQSILVNVVDDLAACDALIPAVANRGSIQVAISSGGNAPALSRLIRERVEVAIGPELDLLNRLCGVLRRDIRSQLPDGNDRRMFFESLLASDVIALLADVREDEALELLDSFCAGWKVTPSNEARALLRRV